MESPIETPQTGGVSKPKQPLAPKPRLTPKPFSLQKSTTIRSIHAPKTVSSTFRSTTHQAGKPEATGVPKPLQLKNTSASKDNHVSVQTKDEPEPTKDSKKSPDEEDGVTPLTAPPKETPKAEPLQKDHVTQTHKAATDLVTNSEQRDRKEKEDETSFLQTLGESGSNPTHQCAGPRKSLSTELTSKFESGGLLLPPPPPTTVSTSCTKDDSNKAASSDPGQSPTTPEPSNRGSDEGGGSIKRRISLLFDSSSRPEVTTRREEPEMMYSAGGVKERIKHWAAETSCEGPKTERKPQVAPRPRSTSFEPATAPTPKETPKMPHVELPVTGTSWTPAVAPCSKVSPAGPPTESPGDISKDVPPENKSLSSSTETLGEQQSKSPDAEVQPHDHSPSTTQTAPNEGAGDSRLKRDNVKRRSVRFGVVERDDGGSPVVLGSASESSSEEEQEETEDETPVSLPVYRRVGILQKKDDETKIKEEAELKHLEFEQRRRTEENKQTRLELEEKSKQEDEECEREKARQREELRLREEETWREEERKRERLKEEKMDRSPKEEWEREGFKDEERKRLREGQMEAMWQRQGKEEREIQKEKEERLKEEKRQEERLGEEREREEEQGTIHEHEEHRLEEEMNKEKHREEEWERECVKNTESLREEEEARAREKELELMWQRQKEEDRERARQKEERLKQEERENERLKGEAEEREVERQRNLEEEERMRERQRQKEERETEEAEQKLQRENEEEMERMRQIEKHREEERREEERRRQMERERVEELERKRAKELEDKERMDEEREREELEQAEFNLISFDPEDAAQRSETPQSPFTLYEPPQSQAAVTYEDFSVRKPLIQVEFDDFSVKPKRWGSQVKPEPRPVAQSWTTGPVDEEEEEVLVPLNGNPQGNKEPEQEAKPESPEPTAAVESQDKEEEEEQEVGVEEDEEVDEEEEEEEERPEERLLFSTGVEEDGKDVEREEEVDEEGEEVKQEAPVNSDCVRGEDKDTDALIDNEPDQQNGGREQTSERDSPKPISDQGPEVSSQDVETTDFHSESAFAPFPESATPLLDTTAQRSKADVGKKRMRTRPSRSFRVGSTQRGSPDWRARDSTDEKEASSNQRESESEEEQPQPKIVCSPPPTSHRVPVFPGLNNAALIAQLKRRTGAAGVGGGGEATEEDKGREERSGQPEETAQSPSQLSRSPRSAAHLAGAARVLPPLGGTESGATSSPAWLKELKSKKRLSQHGSET